jgi:flagellar FliJ protein
MAKFHFPLDGVLRHREIVEQEKHRAFALARAEKEKIQVEVRALDEAVRKALADLRANHLTGSLDLAFLAAHRRFMLSMQRQGLALLGQLQEAQQKAEAAQAELAEAAKQKKLLEKLRERQQARWAEALGKKELADLDEVAMQMSFQTARQAERDEMEMTR